MSYTSEAIQPFDSRQPKQLYLLFFAEMWERFSFYGMKALLIAYMTSQLGFDDPKSYAILGSYAALVYTMPMFGGFLADKFIGYRRAVIFGGILMTIGHIVLALPNDWSFFYGMAFIICGNGFFKPNISSLVGTLYTENDPRRDSGFSIFYMGINIGAAIGGFLCAYVATSTGNWHWGFGLAGIFMFVGLIVFIFGQKSLGDRGLPPDAAALNNKAFGFIKPEVLIYGGTLIVVPLVVMLFHQYELMDYIMFGLGAVSLIYVLTIGFKLEREARLKLFAALIMIIFSIIFWAVYEQNAGSMNLLAERNSSMSIFGIDLPELAINNFLPPGWVIILTLLIAPLWPWLNKRGKEPGTPFKFALSFIFLGIGFYVFYLGCLVNEDTGVIPLWPFFFGYMFIIVGELCISPIGLSMVTKLSPARMVSMMMGIWFFASAIGEFLAGKIGSLMSVPKEILDKNDPVLSLPYYADVIQKIGISSVVIGILLMFTVPFLKKWMGGIK